MLNNSVVCLNDSSVMCLLQIGLNAKKVYNKFRFHAGAKPAVLKPRFSVTSQR